MFERAFVAGQEEHTNLQDLDEDSGAEAEAICRWVHGASRSAQWPLIFKRCACAATGQTVLLQPLHFVKGSPNYILMPVPQL